MLFNNQKRLNEREKTILEKFDLKAKHIQKLYQENLITFDEACELYAEEKKKAKYKIWKV